MFRMKRDLNRRDDGFTVVEIVVAASVLFFVLTAVLGLVASTTSMSLSAKQRTTMVNSVSSHMEWIRSLSFDELDIRGTSAEAAVDAERVLTVEGYTITITTQITSGRSGTKEVNVRATASAPGRSTLSMESFSAVWDKESGLTDTSEDPNAPIVTFGLLSPPADSTLYGTLVHQPGGTLIIDAEVSSPTDDRNIVELVFRCSAKTLRDGTSNLASLAVWTMNEPTVSESFFWDTRQVDDEVNTPSIADGWRYVSITARDDQGSETRIERRFYVDNIDPGPPGVPTARVYDNVEARVSWDIATDGTHAAQGYQVMLWQVTSSDETTLTKLLEEPKWEPEAVYLHTGTTFSRYIVGVWARSPRVLLSDYVEMATPYVTRPEASGGSETSFYGSRNSVHSVTDVSISCTPPNFPVSSVTYDVYRSLDPNNMGTEPYATDVGPDFTDEIDKLVRRTGVPDPWYYQFRVSFVAEGYGGGSLSEAPVYSDVIGPTSTPDRPDPIDDPPESVDMGHVQW